MKAIKSLKKGNTEIKKQRRLAEIACNRADWHRATAIDIATELLSVHYPDANATELVDWCFNAVAIYR